MHHSTDLLNKAARAIADADAVLIGAGAGMGVDSGLPDFRGNEGFWQAYPAFRHLKLSFVDLADPRWFYDDPQQAWGFYGHRFNLYCQTEPHRGFTVLLDWCRDKHGGGFVFTSNVDGQFQKAGFVAEQIVECHGSIHHLQCVDQCTDAIWPAENIAVAVDPQTLRAEGQLPQCPNCGAIARPNILMFGDGHWLPYRTDQQAMHYQQWLSAAGQRNLVVIELGAGTAVPTVRWQCERAGGQLIRINPRDAEAPAGAIVLPLAAEQALVVIHQLLDDL